MCVCVKKLVFKGILGSACKGGENVVPIVLPDICWLILKQFFTINPAILTMFSVKMF